ncbi:MAG: D-arabinono-1,4-lactone oxidase [Bacteroidia bacterium]
MGMSQFFSFFFQRREERKIRKLVERLEQNEDDAEAQEHLFNSLDKTAAALEKEIGKKVRPEHIRAEKLLAQEIIARSAGEREQRRSTRKKEKQERRQARYDRKEARKAARKRRKGDREENLMEALEKRNTGRRKVWYNAIESQKVQPLRIFYPESLEALIDIVEEADELGIKVKAVGSGHSASNIVTTSDFMVYTHGLDEPLELDRSILKEETNSLHLFEAEAGITVRELNGELEDAGLALPNAGGSDVQTLMGAISTATHGSGIKLGSYPDLVRSMVMVTTEGKVYRIEPSDGITDPLKYNDPDIPLVQNDEWFYAAVVSMGCLGIVYSLIIEVVPSYWLKETRELILWSQLKPLLAEGSILQKNEHFEVYLNPYKTDGDYTCLITTRKHIDVQQRPKGPPGRRNFFSSLLLSFSFTPKVMLQLFLLMPKKTPALIDRALKALVDEAYINKSYLVLNQGLRQVKTTGTAIEMGFPLSNYLPAVERIFEIAAERAGDGGQYVTSPFALRFVKSSKAYMSMMNGTDTCMIEITTLTQSLGRVDMLRHFQEELYAFGARPHWGLELDHLTGSHDLIKKMYPEYDKFIKVFNELNYKGTFNNAFTDRVGFSEVGFKRE